MTNIITRYIKRFLTSDISRKETVGVFALYMLLMAGMVWAYDSSYTGAQVDQAVGRANSPQTTVRAEGSSVDTALVSEDAVRDALDLKQDILAEGAFVDGDKTKLSGIAAGAEVNPAVVSQEDAEAGVATDERIWTAERVKQAVVALAPGDLVSQADCSTITSGFCIDTDDGALYYHDGDSVETVGTDTDAFTVKVDAAATAGYIGAADGEGVIRTDGTILTKTDGGDYVTLGVHAYLADLAGITANQGDIIYFDGTDWVDLGPGVDGQYLQTQGAGANPQWASTSVSGDIEYVGDVASGAAFTPDGAGNTLYFEGTTANAFEIALTGADPGADVVVTIPAATGTLLLSDGDGSALTGVDAATGDSATAFFDAGAIEHEYGGLEADVSAYDGLVKITGGASSAVTVTAFAESILDDANEATFKQTVNLEIGTDVLAQQTIGIANDNLVEIDDADAADNDYAKFTVNGLEGRSYAEVLSDIGAEAVDAEIVRADTADTIGAEWVWQDGVPITFGTSEDIKIAYDETTDDRLEITTTLSAATGDEEALALVYTTNKATSGNDTGLLISMTDTASPGTSHPLEIQVGGTAVWWVDSSGQTGTPAVNNPYYKWDENDGVDYYVGIYDTTVDRLEIRRSATVNTNVDAYFDANGAYVAGNLNLSTGHTYQINGTQIALANLSDGESHAANHIQSGADEIDGDLIDIDYAETNYTPATTGVATNVNHLAAHLEGIDAALGAISGSNLAGLTDTADVDYAAGTILIGDGSDSMDQKAISGVITLDGSGATAFANGDRGDFTFTGGSAALDADVVDSAEIADGAVDAIHLAADVIDESKIADNGIDSEHYNDGSIDAAHLNFTAAPGAGNDNYAVTYDNGSGGFTLVEMTGGAETNSLETTITGIADTEIFVGSGADAGAFVTVSGHGSLANTGALTVVDFALTADADAGDYDIKSVDKLEGVDADVYVDLGAQGVAEIQSDTTVQIGASDENLQITDGGTNQINIGSGSGVSTISFGAINMATTGTILGATNVVVTTDGTESPTAAQMYGTFFVADHATATSDTDYTLPTAAAGMVACFYDNGGGSGGIIIDAAAGDEILLNGAGVGVADAIDSPGVAGDGANGDFICIMAIDDTNWITLGRSGTWVDGGAD